MNYSSKKPINSRIYIYFLITVIFSLLTITLFFSKVRTDKTDKIEKVLIHFHFEGIRLISEIRQSLSHIEEEILEYTDEQSWEIHYKNISPYLYRLGKEIDQINELQNKYRKADFTSLAIRLDQKYEFLKTSLSTLNNNLMTFHIPLKAVGSFNIVLTQFQLLHLDQRSIMISQLNIDKDQNFKILLLFFISNIFIFGFLVYRIICHISFGLNREKEMRKALAQQGNIDSLTGLYNRRYLGSWIKEEMLRAERTGQILAVLICNLDRFKSINDSQGHNSGDEVLVAFSKIVLGSVRGADLAIRWGGDEFVLILTNTHRDGVLTVGSRIRKGTLYLSEIGYKGLDVSMGVSLYPEHGILFDELIRSAEQALYIAKKSGDKIHIGEEEYSLNDNSIKVVFQPVMDLRANQPLGYEALSRDPSGKLSITQLFMKYHSIGKLQELKQICFHLQIKVAQEARVDRLFINVDFKLLQNTVIPPLPSDMEIILEISEGEVLDDLEASLSLASKWREAGYKFAMDDFGAGFISLPFISRLAPEYIKLDRSTVLQAVSSTKFRAVLKDFTIGLSKISTDGIIAEGIETEEELGIIREMGIHLIQGYLFGKPQELKSLPKKNILYEKLKI